MDRRLWTYGMRETIEMVVKALVDDAEAVDVREIEREGTTRIEIRVAQTDMGKVIGKQGRTVRALRSLVYAAGVKQHRRFVLDVVE
ncbi:MAG TPA: KH domain-containing protein [Pyrinomonadaceae bacterium]|nr:KH domain-containing protein [Pyrinomonadaceae bacterium]